MIDYNLAAQTYDNTRSHSDLLIDCFAERARLSADSSVLDFGCGTGNYLLQLRERFHCRCCGVEPSEGMRAAASQKGAGIEVRPGDHRDVPFDDDAFDFVFMTDVIHHVPDLRAMFGELQRVLKRGGMLCVVTQSHPQIEARFYNGYFPSLARNEKGRYPDIDKIMRVAAESGLGIDRAETLTAVPHAVISAHFLKNVEEKNYSMFRVLSDQEFKDGLEKIRADLGREVEQTGAGETLIWFRWQ
jgi:ubiquinone/menaquinone biosynthesis C-methylase UbiE